MTSARYALTYSIVETFALRIRGSTDNEMVKSRDVSQTSLPAQQCLAAELDHHLGASVAFERHAPLFRHVTQ